ncbi:MAG: hypothetical protein HC930_01505 [Hydrococcus sp. SU_1_0]|nr:hypothetical protein [Hydrococcus sp. SU_1_0]
MQCPMYDLSLWQACRWQSATRYYTAEVLQDLFGGWVLRLGWGGLHNRKGRSTSRMMSSYDEAIDLLRQTREGRERRGYRSVR